MSVSAESAFDDPVSYAVGGGPAGVTIGDIDGDGLADVAVANVFSGDVSLLINDGSGLQPEQRIPAGVLTAFACFSVWATAPSQHPRYCRRTRNLPWLPRAT